LLDRVVPAAEVIARREGKSIVVQREGDDVEIARATAERLTDPLVQLVRNAVTHGLEAAPIRLAAGKPARATLRLSVSVDGPHLRVSVEDDGAGIDVHAARARAIAMGLLTARQARDDDAVLAVLFRPGVSTRAEVNTTAGRGIGLDLVQGEIGALGGTITVKTRPRRWTRFTVEIPLRQLLERVIIVAAGDNRYAVPLGAVLAVQPPDDRDVATPALDLATLLETPRSDRGRPAVLAMQAGGRVFRVAVDDVERAREVVLRPLPAVLDGVPPWLATTVDGEGRVVLVIDPTSLRPER
jgi:two-component system chemotaxis sensor kinase CheA